MMSDINILTVFYAFSAGASWLLGVLCFLGINRINVRAERWLGIFYAIVACTFTRMFLEIFGIGSIHLLQLLELPTWAMLPCLYMAIHYFTKASTSNRVLFLHFIPFLIFFLFTFPFFVIGLTNVQIQLPELPLWFRFTIQYFFSGQMIFYWIACLILLRRHQKNIKMLASYTEKIDLQWLRMLLISFFFLILIRILSISNLQITYIAPILYFLATLVLAYSTLTQRSIYTNEITLSGTKDKTLINSPVNERLSADQVKELKSIVMLKTVEQKLYLDPLLTLKGLADKIGLNTHELSYVLNNGLGKNFYHFINELRTEEAKSLLLSEDMKHLDLLGIAINAGFNSKTTFYTTFKKLTGLTPKEYMQTNSTAI